MPHHNCCSKNLPPSRCGFSLNQLYKRPRHHHHNIVHSSIPEYSPYADAYPTQTGILFVVACPNLTSIEPEVCLGYGVVRPSLAKRTTATIIFMGVLYGGFALNSDIRSMIRPFLYAHKPAPLYTHIRVRRGCLIYHICAYACICESRLFSHLERGTHTWICIPRM